ncbi:MAG: biosynthetic-type acetolactate synthase large subunit [Butyrivibrio sp.]|jgi:acetolactate synthase-1/2/3 large subunit|uniref:Acetolactate synthase n=1 Tax=Butyrivibrio hungatei TaxID=185008 RepID=A0A1G5B4G7_9FIRM|nr:biosynthetic-type acetolactate synthase large subunit [Butyrivibrio hungatei]MBQ2610408.1 biosynthetic-type acetolactate synthase large subunit [Butyrivibrio sp.]SCX85027.1 acetolactate synthase, large subunit [Butyrivibrio hungatei]
MQLNGSQIVLECLKEQGVDTIFGYPGGSILNIYDELYKQSDDFLHIRTSHEQGAAHAADGYARSTGKVGVCFATSGPGATNLVTGIATAYMDSVPMVAITCNVNLPLLGKDTFQEADIAGITMPITKHGYIVKDVRELADTLRKAFKIASTGRPGPVIVDITKDVTAKSCEFKKIKKVADKSAIKTYTDDNINVTIKMLKAAKRPFIYVGGGAIISGASKEVLEFAEKFDCPVCDTLMGKGAFDGTHPLYTGMIGMHGTKASNYGVSECDLLVTLGARFSDRVTGNTKTFASKAKILQIDIDAAEINKNIRTSYSIVGDLKEVLSEINAKLDQMDHTEWKEKINGYKEKFPLSYQTDKLTCPYIIETLYKLTQGDAIISTDVGQHQMWTAQYYKFRKPRTFLTSGGLGTMGYGLGACIGAKVGNPDKVCVNITGDGCFRMNMQELATASGYGLPIVEIIINNRVLGMVRQWQTLFYEKHYSQTVFEDKVDYCMVAKALGCEAVRITKKEEVEPALKKALGSKVPVVLDCVIEEDDKVFPMVPAGASISEAFDASDIEGEK